MTVQTALATLVGAAIFPFMARLAWGRLVDHFGSFGGWMAAGMIGGTCWTLNHHVGLIVQSGDIWIDMGLSVGVGVLVASLVRGGKLNKALPNLGAALVGSLIGGLILSFIL